MQLDRERAEQAQAVATQFERAHSMLQRLPHVFPHKFRVRLLQDQATREKAAVAAEIGRGARPYITVRRSHLLTDGFRELSRLPARALKATIRIKFINAQGLDEAGIDENGCVAGARVVLG